ncbi:MAG: thioesterase domain-containing protein, partial [Gammaproteobacteria bacterium]
SRNYVAPRTPLEHQLAKIWRDVLHIDAIGVHDNFFELGGHSLLALKLTDNISIAFQKNFSVKDIYSCPTINEFSEKMYLASNFVIPNSEFLIPLSRKCRAFNRGLFLVHPGGGLGLCYHSLALQISAADPEVEVFAINNPRFYNPENPYLTIEEMASSYVQMMLASGKYKHYYLGGWSFGGVVACEMAKQLLSEYNIKVCELIILDSFNFSVLLDSHERKNLLLLNAPQEIDGLDNLTKFSQKQTYSNLELSLCFEPLRYAGPVTLIKSTGENTKIERQYQLEPFNGWDAVFDLSILNLFGIKTAHENFLDNAVLYELTKIILMAMDMSRRIQSFSQCTTTEAAYILQLLRCVTLRYSDFVEMLLLKCDVNGFSIEPSLGKKLIEISNSNKDMNTINVLTRSSLGRSMLAEHRLYLSYCRHRFFADPVICSVIHEDLDNQTVTATITHVI